MNLLGESWPWLCLQCCRTTGGCRWPVPSWEGGCRAQLVASEVCVPPSHPFANVNSAAQATHQRVTGTAQQAAPAGEDELPAPRAAGLSLSAILLASRLPTLPRQVAVPGFDVMAAPHLCGNSQQAAAPCFTSCLPPLATFLNLAAYRLAVRCSSWYSGDGGVLCPQW